MCTDGRKGQVITVFMTLLSYAFHFLLLLQIEGMTKQKIRLEEEQSSLKKELEISRSTPVPTKDPEKEREESLLKEEVAMLKEQLEATKKQLKEAVSRKDPFGGGGQREAETR